MCKKRIEVLIKKGRGVIEAEYDFFPIPITLFHSNFYINIVYFKCIKHMKLNLIHELISVRRGGI
jgi:hypothetical protein